MANPAQKVFVCHSSADKVIAREIAEGLRQLGFDSWFDDWEIKLGDSLVEQLNEGLDAAGAFIILFSKAAAASRWVQEETNAALIKRIRKDAHIIPVRLDKTELPPLLSSWFSLVASVFLFQVTRQILRGRLASLETEHVHIPGQRIT